MTAFGDLRGTNVQQVGTIAHAAATATEYIGSWVAPDKCQIVEVGFIPVSAVTGVDTNTTHLNVDNGGADGTGSTELGNKDLTDTIDLTASKNPIYTPATPLAVAKGNVIFLQAEKVGTGLAIPAGSMYVEYRNG